MHVVQLECQRNSRLTTTTTVIKNSISGTNTPLLANFTTTYEGTAGRLQYRGWNR